jgi:hypothetical protein
LTGQKYHETKKQEASEPSIPDRGNHSKLNADSSCGWRLISQVGARGFPGNNGAEKPRNAHQQNYVEEMDGSDALEKDFGFADYCNLIR